MGIPTIIGVPNLTKIIRDGARVRMDGKGGFVDILK
jgi:phosphohistidine swiveling domain-containing protein